LIGRYSALIPFLVVALGDHLEEVQYWTHD